MRDSRVRPKIIVSLRSPSACQFIWRYQWCTTRRQTGLHRKGFFFVFLDFTEKAVRVHGLEIITNRKLMK